MFPNHDMPGEVWSFGWVVPLVLVLVLAGVVIWAVRLTRQPAAGATSPASPAPPAPPRDTALEQARVRYAQGQIDRETFLQITSDLTPPGARPDEPTVPEPPA